MRERLQVPLSLWALHFDLLGGSKRLAQTYVAYVAVGIAGWSLLRYALRDVPLAEFAGGVANFVAAGQLALLILGGASALHRALLRDFDSRMIESHRLTPLSNVTVVLGYLFGPTMQMLGLFVINVLAGLLICQIAGLSLPRWLVGNVLALLGTLMIWSAAIAFSMRLTRPWNPVSIILTTSLIASPLWIVPGLGVFSGLYAAGAGYYVMTTTKAAPPALIAALVLLTLTMTVFWIFVGAARYRRPDLPALSGVRGLVLLTLWLVIAFGGLVVLTRVQNSIGFALRLGENVAFPWIATLILTILIAAPGIIGSVACNLHRARRAPLRDWSDRVPDLVVTALAVLLIAVPVWLSIELTGANYQDLLYHASWFADTWPHVGPDTKAQQAANLRLVAGWTILSVAIALFTIRSVFRLICALLGRVWLPGLLLPVLFWAAFPLLDVMIAAFDADQNMASNVHGIDDPFDASARSWLFGCSPIGTIIGVSAGIPIGYEPGLLVQLVVLLAVGGVARHFWRYRLRHFAAIPAVPPTA